MAWFSSISLQFISWAQNSFLNFTLTDRAVYRFLSWMPKNYASAFSILRGSKLVSQSSLPLPQSIPHQIPYFHQGHNHPPSTIQKPGAHPGLCLATPPIHLFQPCGLRNFFTCFCLCPHYIISSKRMGLCLFCPSWQISTMSDTIWYYSNIEKLIWLQGIGSFKMQS